MLLIVEVGRCKTIEIIESAINVGKKVILLKTVLNLQKPSISLGNLFISDY